MKTVYILMYGYNAGPQYGSAVCITQYGSTVYITQYGSTVYIGMAMGGSAL